MASQDHRGYRIVVTDDNPGLVYSLVIPLRDAGYCVFAAFNGESACELALQLTDVDLMITNSRIGTVSGRELIRLVRSEKSRLPILHIGDPLPNFDGLLDDVPSLPQPFTSDQLLATVRTLLSRPAV